MDYLSKLRKDNLAGLVDMARKGFFAIVEDDGEWVPAEIVIFKSNWQPMSREEIVVYLNEHGTDWLIPPELRSYDVTAL